MTNANNESPAVSGKRKLGGALLPLCSLLAFLLLGVGSQAMAQSATTIDPKTKVTGQYVKLQSFNAKNSYLRHFLFLGALNPIATPQEVSDSTFKIVAGLAGNSDGLAGNGVSLESTNFQGMYLRHFLFRLTLMLRTPDPLFPSDATFKVVPGLADPTWVSLQSVNFPGHYLRHRGSEFWLDMLASDAKYKADATFKIIVVK